MVAKLIASVRRMPWRVAAMLCLAAFVPILLVSRRRAEGGTFTTPFWVNASPSPECICDGCGCEKPSEWYQNVSVRTGELKLPFPLFSGPGLNGEQSFSLLYCSMNTGTSEFGHSLVASWQWMAQKTILNPGNPTGLNGTQWTIYRPDGLKYTYVNNLNGGATYSSSDCGVLSTLTVNGSGNAVLTDKFGGTRVFDPNGMPATFTAPSGGVTTHTYNSSLQWTGSVDERGGVYTPHHTAYGFADFVDTPQGRFTLNVNGSDDLTDITSPATADQTSGITRTLSYDGSHRLTAVQDGAGGTPWQYAYVTGTNKVSVITGSTIQFSYQTNRTDVTDQNGNVLRFTYSGPTIVQTDTWISGAATYVTEYRYNGNELINIKHPRGNRTEFTHDGNGNLTERRQKTTDTATNSSTNDLYESWTYTNNFMVSHTGANGNTTYFGRDSVGSLTSITYPMVTVPTTQSGVSKSFTVNGSGQVTQSTDEEGKIVQYTYFSSGAKNGLLHEVKVDPSGLNLVTTYDYDTAGNRTTVTDPLSHVTTTTWDAMRRVTGVENAIGAETHYHYDGNGQVTSVDVENLDKDGSPISGNGWLTTSYTYTVHGDVATMTEEIDATHTRTTSYMYDSNQNRIRVIEPERNEEAWTY